STSLYFCATNPLNLRLLERWANCVGQAEFNHTGPCPGHGDQGVLNALLFAEGRTDDIELLDNPLWSQHWTYWDSIIDFRDGRFVNLSAGRLPQRSFHCGGTEKFWDRAHRDRVVWVNPLQTGPYLWFLAMLWFGPLSRLDLDPADWLPVENWHLLQDLVDFLPQIMPIYPPARERWNQVGDRLLDRLIEGVHRAMSLGGSLSELIEIVAAQPQVRRYVEVGSYLGGSILTLALRFLNRDIDFFSVESFQGNLDGTMDGWPLPPRPQYFANLARFPTARVRPVPGDSKLAATLFDDRSLDFIFIDACHDTPAVLADLDCWRPKLAPGGTLAGDDYNWDSVKAAVDERFGTVNVTPTGCVWWVEGAALL
ncbi:MAG: class I SAM-dependent methyltransferase, partial [Planctomycetaceae bacterium]